MFKTNVSVAWRNLLKHKTFSAINIVGLAIGLAMVLLISIFLIDELSYDRFNEKADRTYRVNGDLSINNSRFYQRVTPAPLAAALVRDFSQVEQAVRIRDNNTVLVKIGNATIVERNALYADSNLFKVFSLSAIEGDLNTALLHPNSLVLSETLAKKYFGGTHALGKTLLIDNTKPYQITAVLKDTPLQSHLHFDFIRSTASLDDARSAFWLSLNDNTYVVLKKGVTETQLNDFLRQEAYKYAEPQLVKAFNSTIKALEKAGGWFKFVSIPLLKIHLYSDLADEYEPQGSIQYVYIFGAIGILILIIACINFVNLSTARLAERAKEVGVRKVLGSDRTQLIKQFLTESVLSSFIAFILAVLIAFALLPFLNEISGKHLSVTHLSVLWLFIALIAVAFLVGIGSGAYPAFYLSSFQPIVVLKGKASQGLRGKSWLRNSLVVFQFCIAIILIIGTLVIYSQLNYMRNTNAGYNREQVLVVKNAYSFGERAHAFKKEMLSLPGIISGTITNSLPTGKGNDWNRNTYSKSSTMEASKVLTMMEWNADEDYIPTLGVKLSSGRNFSEQMPGDSNSVIINETAVRMLGFSHPINEVLYDFLDNVRSTKHVIIGVIKDMAIGSMRYKPEPLIMRYSKYGGQFCFKVKPGKIKEMLPLIEQRYHAFDNMAGQPFLYSFMDEDFNKLYSAEQKTGKIFFAFAFFAILISCLGLFGLVTYAAEQRTREIGIRKVLGAGTWNLVTLILLDFVKLVVLAVCIAVPLGWWAMTSWLNTYARHTQIELWIVALATFLAFFITLATTSFQALKAALANPIDSITTE